MSGRIPQGSKLQDEMAALSVRHRIRLVRLAHRGQAAANADDARLVVGVVRELGRSYRFLRFGFAIATGAAFVATVWWATVGTTRWLLVSVGVTAVGATGLLLDIRRRKRMTLAERLNLELLDRGIR